MLKTSGKPETCFSKKPQQFLSANSHHWIAKKLEFTTTFFASKSTTDTTNFVQKLHFNADSGEISMAEAPILEFSSQNRYYGPQFATISQLYKDCLLMFSSLCVPGFWRTQSSWPSWELFKKGSGRSLPRILFELWPFFGDLPFFGLCSSFFSAAAFFVRGWGFFYGLSQSMAIELPPYFYIQQQQFQLACCLLHDPDRWAFMGLPCWLTKLALPQPADFLYQTLKISNHLFHLQHLT